MQILSKHDLTATIQDLDDQDILIVGSANYEPRSVRGVIWLLDEDLAPYRRRIRCGVLRIEPTRAHAAPLEHLMEENEEALMGYLASCRFAAVDAEAIQYPSQSATARVRHALDKFASGVVAPFLFVLDVTAIPRTLLHDIVDTVCEWSREEKISGFYITYSWPKRYPEVPHPFEVGDLIAARSGERLDEIRQEFRRVEAAIVVGAHGFQPQQFVATVGGRDSVRAYFFLNQENLLYSLDVMRANAPLLHGGNQDVQTDYYLNIPDGHHKLLNWAQEVRTDKKAAYLIAQFGPRPLSITAALAVRLLEARIPPELKCKPDVIRYTGYHYATTYSLGYHRTDIYSYSKEELEGRSV